jgi:putative copper resistance protein D
MIALLAAARAVHFASTAMVTGAALFQYFVAEPAFRTAAIGGSASARAYRARLATILWTGFALAVLSGAAWLLALAAKIGGHGPPVASSGGVAWVLLTETQFGHLWMARAFLAGLLFCTLWLGKPSDGRARFGHGLTSVAAMCLMGSLAWSGHAAGSPGVIGDIHLIADVLHLVAAGAWLGGLLPLSLLFVLAIRQTDPSLASTLQMATRRFSTLGLLSVGTLLATGLVNTWMLAGSLPALLETDYGRLLLAKIALFVAMVAIASINRLRLTPGLPQTEAVHRLDRNTRIELALGLAIIAIVSVLGLHSPAVHMGMQMQ